MSFYGGIGKSIQDAHCPIHIMIGHKKTASIGTSTLRVKHFLFTFAQEMFIGVTKSSHNTTWLYFEPMHVEAGRGGERWYGSNWNKVWKGTRAAYVQFSSGSRMHPSIKCDGNTCYNYVLLYTDNALAISKNAKSILRNALGRYFELKEESIEPPKIYLGGH